jgi:hypothetical protein
MKRQIVGLLILSALASAHFAEAQQASKIPTIGILFPGSPFYAEPVMGAFHQGLRDTATLMARRSPLSTGILRGNTNDYPNSRQS